MEKLSSFFDVVYAGAPVRSWVIAAVVALFTISALGLLKPWIIRRLQIWADRTATHLDNLLVDVLASTKTLFVLGLGLWAGSQFLPLSDTARRWREVGVSLVVLVQAGLCVHVGVRSFTNAWAAQRQEDGGARTAASTVQFIASLAVWAVVLIMAFSALGFEISALVAGLGIGGVAAALAVQSLLGDVLASLSMLFDRPFELGDYIQVGNEAGTVERIGLRSTRMRALGGHEIVFANGDLVRSRIHNYKRMQERRVVFTIGVEYHTSRENLETLAGLLRSIIESRSGVRFDRAHFKAYGTSSLDFEVVYYVLSGDYAVYMDHQHAMNLDIFREFQARGIHFAFPTTTVTFDAQQLPQRHLETLLRIEHPAVPGAVSKGDRTG